jgi:hypothetical protein
MKSNLEPYRLVNAQSMASTITSEVFEAIAYFGLAVQYKVSSGSSPTGSLAIQMSNDRANWVNVPTDTVKAVNPVAITANVDGFWLYQDIIPMKWIRVVYTRTSGSGTLDVWASGVRLA